MAEFEKLNEEQLDQVAGGAAPGSWVRVCNLQTGYLALRTMPTYDYNNEIRGSESYNGDPLQVMGGYTWGSDGKPYVWVKNPRTGMSGWVNANFISG